MRRLTFPAILVAFYVLFISAGVRGVRSQQSATALTTNAATTEIHYSPAENLENYDLMLLGKTQEHLDMVLYAFDDKTLATELVNLAARGVAIRIYRDQTQYNGEVARGVKGGTDLNKVLAGFHNVQIKVKGNVALAHLKSYCVDCSKDGGVLRDGSANWSVSGEKVQDNSFVEVVGGEAPGNFEFNFEQLWARPTNKVVQ